MDMDDMDTAEPVAMMMMLIVMSYAVFELTAKNERRWWVREMNRSRDVDGYFNTCFKRMKELDPEDFFKHTRMTLPVYELLLGLIKEDLTKHSIRTPISAECRLAVTLSYLSQGVQNQYLAWSFKMGKETVRTIVLETCDVLWKRLSPTYVPVPNKEDYIEIAELFKNKWDLPNCVGAIDGKHINIQRPANSGSTFYNYKHFFSIVLLAACDARYCFTAIDVGAYGSQSDGGILANSDFGKLLLGGQLPLPEESFLPKSTKKFPYFFVGDPAFPLKNNIMRPYPGKLLERKKRILNYRISRARVVIENAFGILVARWRILKSSLCCNPDNAEKIVLATVALHNFILKNVHSTSAYCPPQFTDWEDNDGVMQSGAWRNDVGNENLQSVRVGSNNASRTAFKLPDILMEYCLHEGAIPNQNKIK